MPPEAEGIAQDGARKTVETEDPDEIIARKHLFHEAHESLKG